MTPLYVSSRTEKEPRRASMRKFVVAAALAAGVAVLATAALGSTNSSSRTTAAASPATATVKCGKTRTIGMAAPYTGPAADIGNQQVRWAKYYVKRWNAQKANKNKQIKIVPGDTQLGVDTAFAVRVAKSFASNSKLLGVVGPAGSQEVVASTSAYRGGWRRVVRVKGGGFGLPPEPRDPHLAHGRPHGRQPPRVLVPRGAERRGAGPGGRELDDQEAEVEARLHHR